MPRTTAALVQGIMGDDFGPRADGSTPDLVGPIRAANIVVNRVATLATQKGTTLSSDELTEIETWVAAHMYQVSDKTLQSKSMGGGSDSYSGQTGMDLEASQYGQMAMTIDYSGALRNINKRQFASIRWIGKPPSSQIDYNQRD